MVLDSPDTTMETELEKILRTIEKISFTVIGLFAAIFLINTVVNLGPGSYGRTLLDGISIYMIFGAVVILLWVSYNVFANSRPEPSVKKK